MKTRVMGIVFIATISIACAYILFLISEYSYWFAVNSYNKTVYNVFGFILQLSIQALIIAAVIVAIKNKKGLALGLLAIPILLFSILLLAPNSMIKSGFSEYVSQIDKVLFTVNFSSTLVLFLLTLFAFVFLAIDVAKKNSRTSN